MERKRTSAIYVNQNMSNSHKHLTVEQIMEVADCRFFTAVQYSEHSSSLDVMECSADLRRKRHQYKLPQYKYDIYRKSFIPRCLFRYITALRIFLDFCARQLYAKRAYAIAIPSVCLSVRPSVTRVDQSKMVEVRIVQFSLHSSPSL